MKSFKILTLVKDVVCLELYIYIYICVCVCVCVCVLINFICLIVLWFTAFPFTH